MSALGLLDDVSDEETVNEAKTDSLRRKYGILGAHFWQRHNLRMEDFCAMPKVRRLFYIASEIYEAENPSRLDVLKFPTKK